MHMSLFTDASHCPSTGAAGWGAWAKCNLWSSGALFGGGFKSLLSASHEAELCAIANAMHVLGAGGHLSGVTVLMIQSDNLRALGLVKARVPRAAIRNHADGAKVPDLTRVVLSEAEQKGLGIIESESTKGGFSIHLRHVRGHRRGPSRQWVNRQCDRIAKQHMYERRGRIGKE